MFRALEYYAIYPDVSVACTAAHRQSYSRRLLGVRVKAEKPFPLILQHWAGVSFNTSSYELAETCDCDR
jgi:hypothetical protein